MSLDSLEDLYVTELKDLYAAEQQIIKALPKMIKAVSNDDLREALDEHLDISKGQIDRLDKVGKLLKIVLKGKKNVAVDGLLKEAQEIIDLDGDADVKDAALIAAVQKIQHYEIASYGSVKTWATLLVFNDQAELLEESLVEEKEADETLTAIAEENVNVEAGEKVRDEDEDEDEESEEVGLDEYDEGADEED